MSYLAIYPQYTQESVNQAVRNIKRHVNNHGFVDVIELDFYLRPKRFGGKGYGKLKKVV